MKKTLIALVIFLSFGALAAPKLNIITTTPDLAFLVQQLGGQRVQVSSLLSGAEDPHYVDVTPVFIAKVMSADMVCFVGLDLEVGWLPKVLNRAGKKQLLPGGDGHCDVSSKVDVLDKLEGAPDRSMGDVHAKGNSHYTLSPGRYLQAAQSVKESLIRVDGDHAVTYEKNYQQFSQKIQALQKEIENKLKSVRAQLVVIDYHSHFRYYLEEFQLKSLGAIEEVPGVSPSAGRLAQSSKMAKEQNLDLILAAHTAPHKILERFSSLTQAPVIKVPIILNREGEFSDYFVLQRWLVDEIVKHAK